MNIKMISIAILTLLCMRVASDPLDRFFYSNGRLQVQGTPQDRRASNNHNDEYFPRFRDTYSATSVISTPQTHPSLSGLSVKCGGKNWRIVVKREYFGRGVPFSPDFLRLGNDPDALGCTPLSDFVSSTEMVISAGLQDCGSESRVSGDWLIYSNNLVFSPGPLLTVSGSLIVRGVPTVVPIECHYRRRLSVRGEPLSPTWLPMTSTIHAIGLLHFSLRIMADDWSSPRHSTVFQQGEPVFLEAALHAPLHPPLRIYVDYCVASLNSDPFSNPSYKFIANHGCLIDSLVPNSSSQFFARLRENSLRFSIQAFRFSRDQQDQVFISCHLRATPHQTTPDPLNKACSFHGPLLSWHAMEGDNDVCQCCDTGNCSRHTTVKTDRYGTPRALLDTEEEPNTGVGPLQILPNSYWKGQLSIGT